MEGELASVKGVPDALPRRKKPYHRNNARPGPLQGVASTQDQGCLRLHVCPCPVGRQVLTTRSNIKLLRISGWQQEIIKPSAGPSRRRALWYCAGVTPVKWALHSCDSHYSGVHTVGKHSGLPSFSQNLLLIGLGTQTS